MIDNCMCLLPSARTVKKGKGGTASAKLPASSKDAAASKADSDGETVNYARIIKELPEGARPLPGAMRGKHNYTLTQADRRARIQVQSGARFHVDLFPGMRGVFCMG